MNYGIKTQLSKRQSRCFYLKGININYSFKTLEMLARDMGATLTEGDILIADNANGDKRKAYRKIPNGHVILYVGLNDKTNFRELENTKGVVADQPKSLLQWFL